METARLPLFEDIVSASEQIKSWAVRTPILHHPALDEAVGGRVYLKPENLQRTGSFKFRGAFNTISRLSDEEQSRGIVAFSSGNHAQGVAEAARLLSISAKIVMPADAPEIKKRGVISRGAEVIEYDRVNQNREEICRQLAEKENRVIIPPYEHHQVMAGQGTAGLEIAQDLGARGETADQLICCVGGGGLIAGVGLAMANAMASTRIYGAEPVGFDDTDRSLKLGRRVGNESLSGSICDSILADIPGELTFELNRKQLSGVGVVSDDEVREAMRFAFRTLKLVVEPGGCAALAALLSQKVNGQGKTSVVVLTGGNVDPELYSEIITSSP